jgi:hypothetical protein
VADGQFDPLNQRRVLIIGARVIHHSGQRASKSSAAGLSNSAPITIPPDPTLAAAIDRHHVCREKGTKRGAGG